MKNFRKSEVLVSGACTPRDWLYSSASDSGNFWSFLPPRFLTSTCILTKTEGGSCREPVSGWNAPSTCPSADPSQLQDSCLSAACCHTLLQTRLLGGGTDGRTTLRLNKTGNVSEDPWKYQLPCDLVPYVNISLYAYVVSVHIYNTHSITHDKSDFMGVFVYHARHIILIRCSSLSVIGPIVS